MINDEFKQSVGYKYYKAKKVKSEKAKAADELEEQNMSPVRSGRGKGYMRSVELAKSISIKEQHTQQRRSSQLKIDSQIDNNVEDTYAEWGQKLKGEGSSVVHTKFYDTSDTESDATHYSSCSDTSEESTNETNDVDDSNMDLTDDEPKGDNDTARYDNLLDETPINELTDLMYNPVYIDAHTTSVVHNPEGNPKARSFLSNASEVPYGTHVYVQATNLALQEMCPDDASHYISSPLATATHKLPTYPQPNSLQTKAKKLMQNANKNMRKINLMKAFSQKFKEYDQKLEALTNINVSKAFEKAVQARVLTEIKKLLPTHIPTTIANYVRPRLNTSVLEIIKEKKSPVAHVQDDTPAIQTLDQQDEYIWTRPNPEWYTKSGSAGPAKRRKTWFDLLLKSDIDQNENHVLGPSTIVIEKKLKELIQKDEVRIVDLEGAGLKKMKQQYKNDVELEYHVDQLKAAVLSKAKWNSDKGEVSNPRSFKRHMSKNTKPHLSFYNNDFYYLVSLSTKEKYTTSLTKHYAARYYIQGIADMISDRWRFDDNEYEFNYADLPKLSLNDVEDMYLLQVQDKLYHLLLEFVKDINNALLLFI
ncbi:hypothetical protein Tco_0246153 [Tanacetum coccineum]